MAEEKQSFFSSKAFFLIIAWLVLGVVLSVVIYKVSPSLEHQCETWASQLEAAPHGGDNAHGDTHGEAKT